MYQKNYVASSTNDFLALRDLDNLTMPMDVNSLIFTPSTMERMETTLIGLDGAFDSDSDSYTDDSNQECSSISSSSAKRQKTSGSFKQLPGPKSRRRLEDMTPEEINRRQRRRERNKAAAARCRQRRLDLTNQLLNETQILETEGQQLEREIENLRRQRDQLEFVLEAHRPTCRSDISDLIKNEAVASDNVQPTVSMSAVRPTSLAIGHSIIPALPDFDFDLGSTGVTPVISSSGQNVFLGLGADFMSPTTLLGSPTSLLM